MGTDIHFYAEFLKPTTNHYRSKRIKIDRNYVLFSHLIKLSTKGKPHYISSNFRKLLRDSTYHTPCYCSIDDIVNYDWTMKQHTGIEITGESYLNDIPNCLEPQMVDNEYAMKCFSNVFYDESRPYWLDLHLNPNSVVRPQDTVFIYYPMPLTYICKDFTNMIPYLQSLKADRFVFCFDN